MAVTMQQAEIVHSGLDWVETEWIWQRKKLWRRFPVGAIIMSHFRLCKGLWRGFAEGSI